MDVHTLIKNELCQFCDKRPQTKQHYCTKRFCYEHILLQFFVNVWLDCDPSNSGEFFCFCLKRINERNIFQDSANISQVIREYLAIFISEYDCF